jgi:alcohol dehydrogenase
MRLSGGFSYHCPLKIHCGSQALAGLPMELVRCGARRPLILADPSQVEAKRFQRVVDAFRSSGLTMVLRHGLPDPLDPDRLSMLFTLSQDGGCDSLIAVGCDGVVDTAKCLSVLIATHDREKKSGTGHDGDDLDPSRPLLLVTIPGGDGNEATPYARDGNGLLRTDRLMPSAAFIDPVMMAGHEPAIVSGGLIGLVHAVEASLDPAVGFLARAHAHAAIGLILRYLPLTIGRADHRIAISGVVCGQMVAGCAFSASQPGVCHTLATHLASFTDVPPGYLMAILLPFLLAETARENADPVGRLMYPMVGAQDYALTAKALQAPRVIAWLWEYYDTLNAILPAGMPTTLKNAGMTDDQLRQARASLGNTANNDIAVSILSQAS